MSLTILLMAGALMSRERDRWVNHSLEVLQNLERYEANIIAAQVRVRDMVPWTDPGTEGKLAESGLLIAQHCVATMLELTEDNPRQAVRIRVLKSFTEQLADRLHAKNQAPPLIGIPLHNPLTDVPLGDTISEIRRDERALLETRQRQRSSADDSFWVFTALVITSNLVIVWWAYTASRRYVYERNRTEFEIRDLNVRLGDQVVAIQKLNSSLEDRVTEKTGELEATVAKLQMTNQELERFAYVASHDMQEPLRQVASFNNLLALKYGDQLDGTASRYLEYSVSGAKRLQLMLRGLLQYTVTTPSAVHAVEVPVNALMRSVFQDLHADIEHTEADVKVNSSDGLTVLGDRDMLRTVATALVSNALKFHRKDSRPVVEIAFARQPQQWSMSVSDNGIGVEEHFVPRMFEMFARFHPVGEHPGAGVGLALSKRIVDCHAGKLAVRSNPAGQGTIFTVTVPISLNGGKNSLETQRFPY